MKTKSLDLHIQIKPPTERMVALVTVSEKQGSRYVPICVDLPIPDAIALVAGLENIRRQVAGHTPPPRIVMYHHRHGTDADIVPGDVAPEDHFAADYEPEREDESFSESALRMPYAAAPELLAALRAIVHERDSAALCDDPAYTMIDREINHAREVIARAEGRA